MTAPSAISGIGNAANIRVALYQSLRQVMTPLPNFATVLSPLLAFEARTAAEIADGNHAVNTANKQAGKAVWDTTNNRLMVASGTSQIAPWYVADGSVSITPA